MRLPKPIRSPAEHRAALARIDTLMDAKAGTPAGDELDLLVTLVEHYESTAVPMGHPGPIAAILFRMEQAGLTRRELEPFLGSRGRVSEVLSGKRPLTVRMIRALHEGLGIPVASLVLPSVAERAGSKRPVTKRRAA